MGGLAIAVGWLFGVAWQLQQRTVLAAELSLSLCALGAVAIAAVWRWRSASSERSARSASWGPWGLWGRRGRAVLLVIAAMAVGFGSTDWRAGERLQQRLQAALEGADLRVQGVIDSLPQTGLQGTRFVFAVEHGEWRGEPVALPPRLSLAWYRGFDAQDLLAAAPTPLRAGQRWQFTVRLKRPHGSANPGGFDLERWLFEQGIGASGYVRATATTLPPRLLDPEAGSPLLRLRQHLRDALEAQVDSPTAAGVLAALTIGDQAAIDLGTDIKVGN